MTNFGSSQTRTGQHGLDIPRCHAVGDFHVHGIGVLVYNRVWLVVQFITRHKITLGYAISCHLNAQLQPECFSGGK